MYRTRPPSWACTRDTVGTEGSSVCWTHACSIQWSFPQSPSLPQCLLPALHLKGCYPFCRWEAILTFCQGWNWATQILAFGSSPGLAKHCSSLMPLSWTQVTLLLLPLWPSRCWFGKKPGVYTDYIYQGPMILVLLVRTWVGGQERGAQWGGASRAYSGLKGSLCLEVAGRGPGICKGS